jgi:hypothetical protein
MVQVLNDQSVIRILYTGPEYENAHADDSELENDPINKTVDTHDLDCFTVRLRLIGLSVVGFGSAFDRGAEGVVDADRIVHNRCDRRAWHDHGEPDDSPIDPL